METYSLDWNILVIDNNQDDYNLACALFSKIEKRNIRLEWAQYYHEGLQKLKHDSWTAVFVDDELGPDNGARLIQETASCGVTAPFIMVAGQARQEADRAAIEAGAFDYLNKDELSPALLERVVHYAAEKANNEKQLRDLVAAQTEALKADFTALQQRYKELVEQLDETQVSHKMLETVSTGYRRLLKLAPCAFLVTDPYGLVLEANKAATELLHRRKKYLLGKPLVVFIPADERQAFRQLVNHLSRTQNIQKWNLRLEPIREEPVTVRAVVSPLRGKDGTIQAIQWLIYQHFNPLTHI